MVIGTFSQQMEKGKNLPQGSWRDQECWQWKNTDLKLTGLSCLIQETKGNPSIKYGILII